MADKETIPALKKRLETISSNEDLRREYAQELADPDGSRPGAMSAIVARAKELGVDEDALKPTDAEVSEAVSGAQPLTTAGSTEQLNDHAERILKLEALAASGEVGRVPEGADPREELNKLWRALEYLANQLNFALPS